MKLGKTGILAFVLLIALATLYRLMPDRPFGFAPQFAMALFGGAVFANKKHAFALPLLSMLISDILYQFCFNMGWGNTPGFYQGQITNYILFGGLTFFGFLMRDRKIGKSVAALFGAPTAFFIASNFFVWLEGSGFSRPKTWEGLMQCYADGIPFYQGSIFATLVFSAVIFGAYYVIKYLFSVSKVQVS